MLITRGIHIPLVIPLSNLWYIHPKTLRHIQLWHLRYTLWLFFSFKPSMRLDQYPSLTTHSLSSTAATCQLQLWNESVITLPTNSAIQYNYQMEFQNIFTTEIINKDLSTLIGHSVIKLLNQACNSWRNHKIRRKLKVEPTDSITGVSINPTAKQIGKLFQ